MLRKIFSTPPIPAPSAPDISHAGVEAHIARGFWDENHEETHALLRALRARIDELEGR